MNGKGKYSCADGDTYEGGYVDGKKHGKGTFNCAADGEVYIGDYVNGKKNG